jgi:hypothetical protein
MLSPALAGNRFRMMVSRELDLLERGADRSMRANPPGENIFTALARLFQQLFKG